MEQFRSFQNYRKFLFNFIIEHIMDNSIVVEFSSVVGRDTIAIPKLGSKENLLKTPAFI